MHASQNWRFRCSRIYLEAIWTTVFIQWNFNRLKITYSWRNLWLFCFIDPSLPLSLLLKLSYQKIVTLADYSALNPLTPKISLVILLTVCHTVLVMLVLRIWYCRSTDNPLIDIFLYSHHLSAWSCIDIKRRNSVLVTYGS